MNTNTPEPFVRETRVQRIDGRDIQPTLDKAGDAWNLSTGEVAIARVAGGIRYDTAYAELIMGVGEYFGSGAYAAFRLYRTDSGRFFRLHLVWQADTATAEIKPLPDGEISVLSLAKTMLGNQDVAEFLKSWYCQGLLPLDDAFVQEWAEESLSADECQNVLVALASRHVLHAEAPEADG
jgi:hypothetical protein